MNGKIVSFILLVLAIAGFLCTLGEMYTSYNVLKSSIYYLATSIFMVVALIIFKKYIQESIKWLNTITLSIYAFFSFIFSLIALYSSPSDTVETVAALPASIFYFAGILAICNMVFIKYKDESSKKVEISTIHKLFRYIILAALLFYIYTAITNGYEKNRNRYIKEHSMPLG